MTIRKKVKTFSKIIILGFFIGFFVYYFIIAQRFYLTPSSPNGIRLYARDYGLGFVSYSHIYVQYSIFNSVDTGVVFVEDDGPGLCGKNADYIVEWIDDSHVSISFKGYDYDDYRTEIIQY